MKIHVWTETTSPDVTISSNWEIAFYDFPVLWNFEIGDQIHYATKIGTVVFEISDVQSATVPNYSPEMRRVTARRK